MKFKIRLSIYLILYLSSFVFSESYIQQIDYLIDDIDGKIENHNLYHRNIEYQYTVIPAIGTTNSETTIFYDFVEVWRNNDLRHKVIIYKIINIYIYPRYFSHEQIYYTSEGLPIYIDARILNNRTDSTDDVLYQERYYFQKGIPLKLIIQDQEYTDFNDSLVDLTNNYFQHALSLLENVQKETISIPPIHYSYPE